jgi:hypothetical protein
MYMRKLQADQADRIMEGGYDAKLHAFCILEKAWMEWTEHVLHVLKLREMLHILD